MQITTDCVNHLSDENESIACLLILITRNMRRMKYFINTKKTLGRDVFGACFSKNCKDTGTFSRNENFKKFKRDFKN